MEKKFVLYFRFQCLLLQRGFVFLSIYLFVVYSFQLIFGSFPSVNWFLGLISFKFPLRKKIESVKLDLWKKRSIVTTLILIEIVAEKKRKCRANEDPWFCQTDKLLHELVEQEGVKWRVFWWIFINRVLILKTAFL
jgi:hypothetical protein